MMRGSMTTRSAISLLLALGTLALCAPALADEPPEEDYEGGEYAEEPGAYGHDRADGHHHHPHVHERGPAPPPYRYATPNRYPQGYGYDHRPRVIEDWEPGDPIPEGYRQDTQSRGGLVKGGAATLFSVYGLTAVVGSFLVLAEDIDTEDGVDDNGVDPEDYYPLFIPVAGPFVTIATADTGRAASAVLVVDGVAQVAGFAMFIAGFAAQKDVLVRIPTYAGGPTLELTPLVGKEVQGVGLHGSF